MEDSYKIRFDSITMEFPGVKALDDVSFGIKQGCVHVLMGENGAGKSTLMKILNGSYSATSGTVYINEQPKKFKTASDATREGVAMIYQELSYMPDMAVEDYLMLCREPRKGCFIDWKKSREEAREILKREDLNYDPKKTLREYSVSDIQLMEITKAVQGENIEILIMDEPTSALSSDEVERLFKKIDELKKRGITILYISHKMDEIFRIADYITVMRDGKHIRTAPVSEYDGDLLVKLMVGREITEVYPEKTAKIGEEVLRVEHLTCKESRIYDISFTVHEGEIFGLGGLMGAGRTEVVRILAGLDKADSGKIFVRGKEVKYNNVSGAINNGIVMASEDRRRLGLILCRDIKENISLSSLKKISVHSFLQKKKEDQITEKLFKDIRVKAPGLDSTVQNLSGGNKQKVVLCKCLMTDADIVILDEPTRGIDVGAKHEIYKLMTELAEAGKGIIMISSETPEFIGMCDRTVIMYKGRVTGELSREELTMESLINYSVGGAGL